MSENTSSFKPEIELPYRFRAFGELNRLLPALRQKQREVVTDPSDVQDLDKGWNLIRFTEKRIPLVLPTIGSDEAELHYIEYPDELSPLINIGILTYANSSPKLAEDDFKHEDWQNGHAMFFGSELEPFIVHWEEVDIMTNKPLGEQIANLQGKRVLSDNECEGIVNLVNVNKNEVSNELA